MSSYPRWKYFLVLLVLLTSIIYSLPNLYHSKPAIEIGTDGVNVSEIIKTLNHPEDSIVYKDNKMTLLFENTDSQLLSYDKLRKNNISIIKSFKANILRANKLTTGNIIL